MAERTEIDCQKISDNWLKISQSAYSEIESLCVHKKLDDLTRIAKLSSLRFVLSLSQLGPELDLDYAAEGNGRLFWLYKALHEEFEEKDKRHNLESRDISDPAFDLVITQTYLAWRFMESYYLIKNLPLSPDELHTTIKSLKSILGCTYNILEGRQNQLPCEFTKVQDELVDYSRGRIRIALNDPNFDMEIPYFRNQVRVK